MRVILYENEWQCDSTGMVIEHQGRLWRAIKIQHTQPGKGGAYLQVELKDLLNGSKLNERFRASENVERVRLDQSEYQFLYSSEDLHTFMHAETYEQVELNSSLIGEEKLPYLQEGMSVTVETYDGKPINLQLPAQKVCTVVEADAVVKGQTATSSYKPALLDNGLKTMVPPHIEPGTKIVVSTEDGSYVEQPKHNLSGVT